MPSSEGPKWSQDEAIAFECARECISHLRAILTSEKYNGNPTPERLAEIQSELSRLFRERNQLHVKDHADIKRIRGEYGRRIRYHQMNEAQAREHLATLGLSFAVEGLQLDADTWRAIGIQAFEVTECVRFDRPVDAGNWQETGAVQQPYWISKADFPRLQELQNRLAALAG